MKYFYLKQNISNWLSWYSSLDCGEFPLLQHDWKLSCCRDRGRRQEAGWQQLSLCVYTFQTCNNHIPLARVNHHTAAINIMNDGIFKWAWSRLTRERVKLSTSSSRLHYSPTLCCLQSLSGSVSCDIIPSPATATQSKQSKETGNWRKVVKWCHCIVIWVIIVIFFHFH